MKVLKRIGITLLVLIVVALLGTSLYGMGEDVFNFIPLWLTKFILGVGTMIIGIIIFLPFAIGIVKIVKFLKGDYL